jgi:phosphoketolase
MSAWDTATNTIRSGSSAKEELSRMDAYWRAAYYISVGQIALCLLVAAARRLVDLGDGRGGE